MKKIGIYFGSSTGTTADVAKTIAKRLNVADADILDVASADAASMANYEVLLLGSSTWGMGDLQDDWEGFLPKAKGQNLAGKCVGLFGCGDSSAYSDTFCDALATIKEELDGTGCSFIGEYAPTDYGYDATRCEQGGKLIGLLIDDINESDKTADRIDTWVAALQPNL
ncbi:flavodoxin [Porphyromonas gingivicanis]|uniref:flavodoxin n=1 Tax=Porphyromonas gingivicanis TaxID=266762 RepID=UPI0004704716|nr:flavodoxin [Porphyromonas gingivicanis]